MMDFWDELNKVYNMDIPDEATEIIGDVMIALTELPERKKGKWIKWGTEFKCDQCHLCNSVEKPYCPNCGAEMREDSE